MQTETISNKKEANPILNSAIPQATQGQWKDAPVQINPEVMADAKKSSNAIGDAYARNRGDQFQNLNSILPGTVRKYEIENTGVNPTNREIYISAFPVAERKIEKDLQKIAIELPQQIFRADQYKARMDKALSENNFIEATAEGKSLKIAEQNIEKFKAKLEAMPENHMQQTANNIQAFQNFKSELLNIIATVDEKITGLEAHGAEFEKQISEKRDKYLNAEEKPAKGKKV